MSGNRAALLTLLVLLLAAGVWAVTNSLSSTIDEPSDGLSTPPVREQSGPNEVKSEPTSSSDQGNSPDQDSERRALAAAYARKSATASVQRLLTSPNQTGTARRSIAEWARSADDTAHEAYLMGLCDLADKDPQAAQASFLKAIELDPQHGPAQTAIARQFEQAEQTSDALPHYQAAARLLPDSVEAQIALARTLRKLGRLEEAAQALPSPSQSDGEPQQALALELAEQAYAAGDYLSAVKWFRAADIEAAHRAETLRTAATAMALSGETIASQQLFSRVDLAQDNSRHASELQLRLALSPSDAKAAEDMRQLSEPPNAHAAEPTAERDRLYQVHCAACHGRTGLADGRAARFLFPRPRNLQTEPMRLVSTVNRIASEDDIRRVIRNGMPGTSMPSFKHLPEDEVSALVDVVQKFRLSGARSNFHSDSTGRQQEADEAEQLQRFVESQTRASKQLNVPEIREATQQALTRGRETFEQVGCAQCHPVDGGLESLPQLFDDSGQPCIPRDLARDFMKGGSDPVSLFRRIRIGMPGTPHPGIDLPNGQIEDLVHYCRSLGRPNTRVQTNHQRAMRAYQSGPHSASRGSLSDSPAYNADQL